jgi:Secretion system C-terminal sorting domain
MLSLLKGTSILGKYFNLLSSQFIASVAYGKTPLVCCFFALTGIFSSLTQLNSQSSFSEINVSTFATNKNPGSDLSTAPLNSSRQFTTVRLGFPDESFFLPVVSNVVCNDNGTTTNSADDFITFSLTGPTQTVYSTYSVTATQNGSFVPVTLSDGSSAQSNIYGVSIPFKLPLGSSNNGNITLTVVDSATNTSNTLIITNPGTCNTSCPAPNNAGTITYNYEIPLQTTELANEPILIPRFDNVGGTRELTQATLSYTNRVISDYIAENIAITPAKITPSLISRFRAFLNGTLISSDQETKDYEIEYQLPPAILVPASGSWSGDSLLASGGNYSTLSKMTPWASDYLEAFMNPGPDPRWVTNATGNLTDDDDIHYFDTISINGSHAFTYIAATDLANFNGSGNIPLTMSTLTGLALTGGGGGIIGRQTTKATAIVTVTYTFSCNTNIPLPITLVSFTAQTKKDCSVQIIWKTGVESNLKRFVIESSTNGSVFFPVATELPLGGGSIYTITDNKAPDGISYYRIRSIDNDGREQVSKIVSVNNNCSGRISIYPNPANDILKIVGFSTSEKVTVQIYDAAGKMVANNQFAGNAIINVDIHTLPKGMYQMKAFTSGTTYRSKLIKY